MRERSVPVNIEKLQALNQLYRPRNVARRLSISKQLWNNYSKGHHDMPESMIDRLCGEFQLDKAEVIAG